MVDIARLGHAHHRMQQQYSVHVLGRAFSQFFMRAMQRIASLKCDDVFESRLCEPRPRLSGSQTKLAEVVMFWQLENPQAAADVSRSPAMHLRDERMADVRGAEHLPRLCFEIPLVDLLNCHHRENFVFRIQQRGFPI
jgi:hypothetical protein